MATAAAPLRLRLDAWDQVETLLERQIRRGAVILRAERPPPIGSTLVVALELPTGQTVELHGRVESHLAADPGGRTGVRLAIRALEPETLFAMESGIAKARRRTGPGRIGAPASSPAHGPAHGELVMEAVAVRPPEPDDFDPLPTDVTQAPLGDALVDGLRAELVALRVLDPFSILGLRIDPTDEEVKEAFTQRSRRYHPSQLGRYEDETARVLVGEIYLLLREAFRRLCHAAGRETTHAALTAREVRVRRPIETGGDAAASPTVVPVNAARAIAPPSTVTPPPLATPAAGARALTGAAPRLTPALGSRAFGPETPEARALATANDRKAEALQPERVLSFRATGSLPIQADPQGLVAPLGTAPGAPPRFESTPEEQTYLDGPPRPDTIPSGLDSLADEITYEVTTPLDEVDAAATDAHDDDARAHVLATLADAEADRWDDAEVAIENLARIYPRSRDVRAARDAILGHRRLAAGERGLALRHFEAAVAAAPGLGLARRGLEAARRAAPATRAVLARLKPRSRT